MMDTVPSPDSVRPPSCPTGAINRANKAPERQFSSSLVGVDGMDVDHLASASLEVWGHAPYVHHLGRVSVTSSARTHSHPSCQGRTPLSFKRRMRTVELARVANLIVGPAWPVDRRLTARVCALPSGPHRRCHLRRASGANCDSGPHPARSASQTVACQKVGPITGVPRLAIRRTHSLSADSSHRRFARPRARHTRATRNRLELRYCWQRKEAVGARRD